VNRDGCVFDGMIMHRILRRFAGVAVATTVVSATVRTAVPYDDVAVIVNVNSEASKTVAAYFQAARAVPAENMIYVDIPEQEVIDSTTFRSLRTQVETYLNSHHLSDAINYLVTTKGVPLKINREANGADPFSSSSSSASVESELSLILGPYSPRIGQPGRVISPYYNAGRHFSRTTFGIYLVTRLDGYTVQNVLDLIDRSGAGITPSRTAEFVFDQDPAWNSATPYLNTYMADAANTLAGKGKNVRLNADSVYVTYASDVLGYISWGSNDHYANDFTRYAIPHNSWAPGAIAETYVSTSARSFADPPQYGQSLIADLIAEGISGAKGYVYEPFSSAMAVGSVLFDSYTGGYNLAESFFQSSVYLSWMDVVVGDPKTSIDGNASVALPVQLSSLTAVFDRQTSKIEVRWITQSEIQNYGFTVQRRPEAGGEFCDLPNAFIPGAGNSLVVRAYAFDDPSPEPGRYKYRLKQADLDGSVHYCEPVIVDVPAATGVVGSTDDPAEFRLDQNYPNPFNPTTVIRGQWAGDCQVTLEVFDFLGRKVATLANGRYAAGRYSFAFDGKNLASGTYLYRLTAGSSTETRRMVLLR
jgi:uncharacterized protein (TIGR03790 family)